MSHQPLLLPLMLAMACGSVDGRSGPDAGTAPAPDAGLLADAGLSGGGLDAGPGAWPSAGKISCEEVRARMLAGDPRALYLNVADEEFYSLGHLEGSLLIPWDLLPGRLSEVDPSRHVVIYCRRGVRSESAQATLAGAGYAHTWIMEGGIERWIALGYPTVE